MRKLRTAIMSLIIFSAFAAGGASAQGDGWQTIAVPGVPVKFSLPEPVKMNEEASQGLVVYAARKEKMSFKVSVMKRNLQEDKAKGLSDEAVLKIFATRLLTASKQMFAQMGFPTEFKPTVDKLEGHGPLEYVGQVGKATVTNRFYINDQGIYWVEATTQDLANQDYKRFLDSFTI
ncbi:MAG: hypothetical protein IPM23_21005 [Candidatus Melainabacteria bacterium]|nr:hypothetical protein [Candidatus Melainabacteria bacterium]